MAFRIKNLLIAMFSTSGYSYIYPGSLAFIPNVARNVAESGKVGIALKYYQILSSRHNKYFFAENIF